MAYIVMAYVVMAYIVAAYIIMALYTYGPLETHVSVDRALACLVLSVTGLHLGDKLVYE